MRSWFGRSRLRPSGLAQADLHLTEDHGHLGQPISIPATIISRNLAI
jgi:hypothetical protein